MLKASEDQILSMFREVHGELSGNCHAEVVYDDDGGAAGVACMKHGYEAWRATLTEIVFDLLANERSI